MTTMSFPAILFLISLGLMVLLLAVIFVLGLILLFSTRSKKELKPLKSAIAVLFCFCGIAILTSVVCFMILSLS